MKNHRLKTTFISIFLVAVCSDCYSLPIDDFNSYQNIAVASAGLKSAEETVASSVSPAGQRRLSLRLMDDALAAGVVIAPVGLPYSLTYSTLSRGKANMVASWSTETPLNLAANNENAFHIKISNFDKSKSHSLYLAITVKSAPLAGETIERQATATYWLTKSFQNESVVVPFRFLVASAGLAPDITKAKKISLTLQGDADQLSIQCFETFDGVNSYCNTISPPQERPSSRPGVRPAIDSASGARVGDATRTDYQPQARPALPPASRRPASRPSTRPDMPTPTPTRERPTSTAPSVRPTYAEPTPDYPPAAAQLRKIVFDIPATLPQGEKIDFQVLGMLSDGSLVPLKLNRLSLSVDDTDAVTMTLPSNATGEEGTPAISQDTATIEAKNDEGTIHLAGTFPEAASLSPDSVELELAPPSTPQAVNDGEVVFDVEEDEYDFKLGCAVACPEVEYPRSITIELSNFPEASHRDCPAGCSYRCCWIYNIGYEELNGEYALQASGYGGKEFRSEQITFTRDLPQTENCSVISYGPPEKSVTAYVRLSCRYEESESISISSNRRYFLETSFVLVEDYSDYLHGWTAERTTPPQRRFPTAEFDIQRPFGSVRESEVSCDGDFDTIVSNPSVKIMMNY